MKRESLIGVEGNATISGPEYTSGAGSALLMTSHMAQPVTAPANPIPLGQATGLERDAADRGPTGGLPSSQ